MRFSGLILLTVIFLTLIDVFVIDVPVISRLMVIVWTLSWTLFLAVSLWSLWKIVYLSTRLPLQVGSVLIVLFLLFFIIINGAVDPKNISGESTVEIACVLNHINKSRDAGLRQTCHLGYPARQFFLPAVVSQAFGRGLFQLNFGNSLYVLLGLPIFALGLIRFFEEHGAKFSPAALALTLLPQFYFFNSLLFLYEQSLFSIGFSLINTGLIAQYLVTQSPIYSSLMILLSLHAVHAYTPSLVLIPLNLGIFAITAFKKRNLKSIIPILILLTTVGISLHSSINITHRQDLRIKSSQPRNYQSEILEFTDQLIFHPPSQNWISPSVSGLFVLSLALSPFLLGRKGLLFSVWIICVVWGGILVSGYSTWSLAGRSFRSAVSIPVISFLIATFLSHISEKRIAHIVVLLLFFTISFFTVNSFIASKATQGQAEFSEYMARLIASQNIQTPGTITGINLHLPGYKLDNINDLLVYFTPGWRYKEMVDINCKSNILVFGPELSTCPSPGLVPMTEGFGQDSMDIYFL